METLTLTVLLEDERSTVGCITGTDEGWLISTDKPVARVDLLRMLTAAGVLERANTPERALEVAEARLRGSEAACAEARRRRDDLEAALEMERTGARSLALEAGARTGETLRDVVVRLKQERDGVVARNVGLNDAIDSWKRAGATLEAERDEARAEAATLRRNLADAQSDNAHNAAELERLRHNVDALNQKAEHINALPDAAEATVARIFSRCTLTMATILAGTQADNPLDGNVLDWEWDTDGLPRVVIRKRE